MDSIVSMSVNYTKRKSMQITIITKNDCLHKGTHSLNKDKQIQHAYVDIEQSMHEHITTKKPKTKTEMSSKQTVISLHLNDSQNSLFVHTDDL
jgi:glutaredoxin